MARSRNRSTSKKRTAWRWSIVILIALAIVVVRLVEDIDVDRSPEARFVVVRVIDGDSVELAGGDRVRLLAVDTPEKGEPLFDRAKDFLSDLCLGEHVNLVYAGRRRDRYGRILAYMYVDTLLVNKAILDNGLGYLYLFKDTDLEDKRIGAMLRAQRAAMKSEVGLWQLSRQPEPYYIHTSGSFRFHRPGCRHLSESNTDDYRRLDSRTDALYEGLSPCRTCQP